MEATNFDISWITFYIITMYWNMIESRGWYQNLQKIKTYNLNEKLRFTSSPGYKYKTKHYIVLYNE